MRPLGHAIALLLAGLALGACSEVEQSSSGGYEPAHLEDVDGSGLKLVTLTGEGARRAGVETAPVRADGRHRVVPHAALIYDAAGRSWVYANPRPLTFLRTEVDVDRIAGDRVLLNAGPAAGTDVVTVGATQVYGAELEIAGGH